MLRTLVFLLCAVGASWLVYIFGIGLFIAFTALAAATFLLSTGQAQEAETTQGRRLTDYHTTRFAEY